MSELEQQMTAADFWTNKDRAQASIEEATALRAKVQPLAALVLKTDDLEVLKSLAEEEKDSAAQLTTFREVEREYSAVRKELEDFELKMLLSGEFDRNNAFLTIHAGAGGTESCDWADMLFRMYQRWIERSGFSSQIIDIQEGVKPASNPSRPSSAASMHTGIFRLNGVCIVLSGFLPLMRTRDATHRLPASMLYRS